ncbi:MAG TPA: hypothetical protein VM912_11940, partial [Terriglobales bacterium]|nr:hypothetical protein [Terriglobales bacterium]
CFCSCTFTVANTQRNVQPFAINMGSAGIRMVTTKVCYRETVKQALTTHQISRGSADIPLIGAA